VKETVGTKNIYTQVGSFRYDMEIDEFSADISDIDTDIETEILEGIAKKAEKLFELYKKSYNRNSVETIFDNILSTMDVSKVSAYGKLYFIPRYKMERIAYLEELADRINRENLLKTLGVHHSPISVNSIFVINDERQRKNFEQEFYNTVEKEIEYYQERLQHFIESGCKSEAVINRWLKKIEKLQVKKKGYEDIFKKSLDKLNDQFEIIEVQAQELKLRAKDNNGISRGRFASPYSHEQLTITNLAS